jgi:hypothetical protein
MSLVSKPPLLVQRGNGTTAGLGYLKARMHCPCKSPPCVVDSVRSACINPLGGNGTIPQHFNLKHNHVSTAPKTNKPQVHANMQPQSKHILKIMCLSQYQHYCNKNP